jgi:hypothetical protein
MDEGSGATAHDSVGSLDLTTNATSPSWSGNGLFIPQTNHLMNATGLTSTSWTMYYYGSFGSAGSGSGDGNVYMWTFGSPSIFQPLIRWNHSSTQCSGLTDNNTFMLNFPGSSCSNVARFSANTLVKIVVTYDSSSQTLNTYLNGTLYATYTGANYSISNGMFYLGGYYGEYVTGYSNVYGVDMTVKKMAWFNAALTLNQINSYGMAN